MLPCSSSLAAVAGFLLLSRAAALEFTHATLTRRNDTPIISEIRLPAFGLNDVLEWPPDDGDPIYPGTLQEISFGVSSDKTQTLEAILYIANGWESSFSLTLLSTGPTPTGAKASCMTLDECEVQKYFSYTVPSFVDKNSRYSNRIVLRTESSFPVGTSLTGNWTARIENSLPPVVENAYVKLVIRQKDHTYRRAILPVIGLAILAALAVGVTFDFLMLMKARRTRTDQQQDQPPSQRVSDMFIRIVPDAGAAVRGLYSRLEGRGQGLEPEGGGPPPAVVEEEEEDEDRCCKICRSTVPSADLFSPCVCKGSTKYVHRQCLEEWRRTTTSIENKKKCTECKTPFTLATMRTDRPLDYSRWAVGSVAKVICKLLLLEALLLTLGYTFKLVAGVITNDLGNIIWYPDLYHHIVAGAMISTYVMHYDLFGHLLEGAFRNPLVQSVVLWCTLLFEFAAGYFVHFVFLFLTPMLWDWQVYYWHGFLLLCILRPMTEHIKHLYMACTRRRRSAQDNSSSSSSAGDAEERQMEPASDGDEAVGEQPQRADEPDEENPRIEPDAPPAAAAAAADGAPQPPPERAASPAPVGRLPQLSAPALD